MTEERDPCIEAILAEVVRRAEIETDFPVDEVEAETIREEITKHWDLIRPALEKAGYRIVQP